MPIFDLNHRLQPEFPEVSALGEYKRREFLYINTCRFATFVLVEPKRRRVASCGVLVWGDAEFTGEED